MICSYCLLIFKKIYLKKLKINKNITFECLSPILGLRDVKISQTFEFATDIELGWLMSKWIATCISTL